MLPLEFAVGARIQQRLVPVVGRQGEWIRVRLSPELRHVGTPMRWYRNEDSGFVHESTVESFTK